MKIEYDAARDLLYLWVGKPGAMAAQTVTVAPGIHADLDRADKLIGLEILDASELLGGRVQFEVVLTPQPAASAAAGDGP